MALRRKRTVAAGIVNPDRALTHADRRNQRTAVGRDSHAILFRRAGSDLLRLPIREPLAPQMMIAVNLDAEIHPFSIRRPGCRGAFPFRAYLPAGRAAIQRNHAARLPDGIHFQDENPFTVRRGVGKVHHATFVLRKINRALLRAVLHCRDNSHM